MPGDITGGMCFYVNLCWCPTSNVREELCTSNFRLLAVSLHPFSPTLLHSGLHPSQNKAYHNNRPHQNHPEKGGAAISTLLYPLGDSWKASWFLTSFTQCITCVTHLGKTLDRCYGSALNAYRSIGLYPLGSADHHAILPRRWPRPSNSGSRRTSLISRAVWSLRTGANSSLGLTTSMSRWMWFPPLLTSVKLISFHQSLSLSWPTTNPLLPRSWRKSPTRRNISSLGLRWRQRRSTRAIKITKVEYKNRRGKSQSGEPPHWSVE